MLRWRLDSKSRQTRYADSKQGTVANTFEILLTFSYPRMLLLKALPEAYIGMIYEYWFFANGPMFVAPGVLPFSTLGYCSLGH